MLASVLLLIKPLHIGVENMSEEGIDLSQGDALVVDFNAVEDAPEFEALPRGMYDVVVAECEFGHSQNSGNPMWTIQLEVEDGEYAGRRLFYHLVFGGKGMAFTKRSLARVRPDLVESPFSPEDDEIVASMLGLRARAKVTTRQYDGRTTNNVTDIFPSEDAAF